MSAIRKGQLKDLDKGDVIRHLPFLLEFVGLLHN